MGTPIDDRPAVSDSASPVLLQFNRGVELDSHDIEKEYQKIKTLSPQDESRSRSPHLSPPGSASPEEEPEEDSPGGGHGAARPGHTS